jgi:hypothetical protein
MRWPPSRAVSKAGGGELEAPEQGGGTAGGVLARGGEVAVPPAVQQRADDIAQGGGLRGGAALGGAALGGVGVLAEEHVPHPMRAALDPPVPAPQAEQLRGG